MLVRPVAAVDDGHAGVLGGKPRGAIAGMTEHDDVGVVRDDPHGVGKAFALGDAAGRRVGAGHDLAAETQHGALEGEACARARLVEKTGQNPALGAVGAFGDAVLVAGIAERIEIAIRDLKDPLDLAVREVVDRRNVPDA